MLDWIRIRRDVVLIVLIVAVLATTLGMVWHCHHGLSSADQCTLCHLVLAPTMAMANECQLAFAPAGYAKKSEFFAFRWVIRQIPSRAPPA